MTRIEGNRRPRGISQDATVITNENDKTRNYGGKIKFHLGDRDLKILSRELYYKRNRLFIFLTFLLSIFGSALYFYNESQESGVSFAFYIPGVVAIFAAISLWMFVFIRFFASPPLLRHYRTLFAPPATFTLDFSGGLVDFKSSLGMLQGGRVRPKSLFKTRHFLTFYAASTLIVIPRAQLASGVERHLETLLDRMD